MAIKFTEKERESFKNKFNEFFENRRFVTQDFFNELKDEAEKRNYEPLTAFVKNAGEIYKELEKSTRTKLNLCASDTVPRELRRLSGGDEFEKNFNKAFKEAIMPMNSSTVISSPVITSGEAMMDKEIFNEIREKVKKYQESMQEIGNTLEKYLKRYDGNTLTCLFTPIGNAAIYAHNNFCNAFAAKFGQFEGEYSRLPDHIQTGPRGQTGRNPFQLPSGNSQPNYQRNTLPRPARPGGHGGQPPAPDPNGQAPATPSDSQQGIEFKIEKFRDDILKLREGTVDDRFLVLQQLTKSISAKVPGGSMLTPESEPAVRRTADAYKYVLENIAPFVVRKSGETSRREEWKKGPEGEKSTESLVKDITGMQESQLKFDDWKYYNQQKKALDIVTDTDFQKFGAVFALLKRNLAEGTTLSSGDFRFSLNERSQWKNTGKEMGLLLVAMVRFSGMLLGDNVQCWWADEYETLKYEKEKDLRAMDDKRAAANARLLLEKYRRERASFNNLYKKAWDDFRFGISIGEKATKTVTSLIRIGCLMVNPIGYVAVDAVLKVVEKSVEIAATGGNAEIPGIIKMTAESTELAEQFQDAVGGTNKQMRDKVIDSLDIGLLSKMRDICDTPIAKEMKVSDAVKLAKEFMEPLVSEGLLQLSDVEPIKDALNMISGVKETLSNCVAPVTETVGRFVDKVKKAISPVTDKFSEIFSDEDTIPNWMERWFREAPEKCRKYRGYDGIWDDVQAYLDMVGEAFCELETCVSDCRVKVPGWTQDAQLDVESAYLGIYIKEKQNGGATPDKHVVAERCKTLLESMGYTVDSGPLQRCLNALG